MASKNIISILINSVFKGEGVKDAEKSVKGLSSGLDGVNRALGAFGLALGAKEVFDFALRSRQAAIEAENARNKLTLAAGGAEEYAKTITAAQEATRVMVSETDLANGAFVLLEMNLASNAQEAAKLANAGNILSKAFESQGASVELFNRLLANGSAVLLDNFGISQAQVKIRQEQIQATSDLEEQEARLQAIRELAIDKSERLAETMSQETVNAEQAAAAYDNMVASIGNLVKTAGEASEAQGWLTSLYEQGREAADGFSLAIESISKRNELFIKTQQKLGRELTATEGLLFAQGKVSGDVAEAVAAVIAEEQELARTTAYVSSQARIYEAAMLAANRAIETQTFLIDGLNRAQSAEAARLQGLTGQASTYAQQFGERVTPDKWMADKAEQEQAAEEMAKNFSSAFSGSLEDTSNEIANSISGAVGDAFGRLQETMPDLFGGGQDDPGEFARRLAAFADGIQESDLGLVDAMKAQAGGNPVFSAFFQAIEESDSGAAAAEANRLLEASNLPQVLAVGLAQSIKAEMERNNIMAEAQQIVADQLGEVEKKTVDIGTAAGEMKAKSAGAASGANEGYTALKETLLEVDKIIGGINGKMENTSRIGKQMASDFGANQGPSNATNEQLNR